MDVCLTGCGHASHQLLGLVQLGLLFAEQCMMTSQTGNGDKGGKTVRRIGLEYIDSTLEFCVDHSGGGVETVTLSTCTSSHK